MKSNLYLIITSSFLIFSCKNDGLKFEKAQGEYFSAASQPASVSVSNTEVICNNKYFKFLEVGKEKKPVLLEIEQHTKSEIGNEEIDGEIIVRAYEKEKNAFGKKLWEKKYRADLINLEPRYISFVRSARGESEETSFFVNYFSGEELISFTGPNAFCAIPTSEEKRIIGFMARSNDLDQLKGEDNNVIGLLKYASALKPMQVLKIKSKNVLMMRSIQKLTPGISVQPMNEEDKVLDDGRTVILSSVKEPFDANKIDNIMIELSFFLSAEQRMVKVTIPIHKDRLDLEKAVYDKNMFEVTE